MTKFSTLAVSSIALCFALAASGAEEKAPQSAGEHGAGQPAMNCGHMKEMMSRMEKADGMSVEQKAAAFDAHVKHMREMTSKMHGATGHK